MPINQAPAYNLKVVMKETGIKADVLRAWERRYGLPIPERTAGGHRLYSQYNIETIKWLMARQNEGLTISRAVDLWRELQAEGRDPLGEAHQTVPATPAMSSAQAAQTGLDSLRHAWLTACLAFNESVAEQTLNQAFALHPVETVCIEILQKGLAEMGNLWYANRASVQQEHFASGLAMRRLDTLLTAAAPPTRTETLLVGCPPGEWHSFTALMLSLFLRRRGLNVVYLGANVPHIRFAETAQAVHAEMVVLAAQQIATAATLQQTADLLARQGVSVAYGGRAFSLLPALQTRIRAHFLGELLTNVVERIDSLLLLRPPVPHATAPEPEYIAALHAFLTNRPIIEAGIQTYGASMRMALEDMHVANHFMGENITAALRLGDMAYMDGETTWLVSFLTAQQSPLHFVPAYFGVYRDVVAAQLGEHAYLIVNWLERQIEITQGL